MYYAIIVIVILAIVALYLKSRKQSAEEIDLPYEKCYLLTKNEWYFYKKLKPIADKLGYCVLAKIRLADLVRVKDNIEKSERAKYFAKIKAKHIDFVLCNPENLAPVLLIELDDNSHNNEKRAERDRFVNSVLENVGYKFLRTKGYNDLESQISSTLLPNAPRPQESDETANTTK